VLGVRNPWRFAVDEGGRDYTDRLTQAGQSWWKRLFNVQAPYRYHIRRVVEPPVLDVGCGIGRNLTHLDGRGVGVDTNRHSVAVARDRGLIAYSADEFPSSADAVHGSFETLLFAHVLEHMELGQAVDLVNAYLRYLSRGGRIVVIVPQEAGFASDPTHVSFVDAEEIDHICRSNRLAIESLYSFPLPRWAGRVFRHNETVALLRPEASG
jgi:SAM-dependent methyltransferase